MPSYRVTWEIDVEADSPSEAAEEARKHQVARNTTATVFNVIEHASDRIPLCPDGKDHGAFDVIDGRGRPVDEIQSADARNRDPYHRIYGGRIDTMH